MSGKQAKRLRRAIFGDFSQKASDRKYEGLRNGGGLTIVAVGRRRAYQMSKEIFGALRAEGFTGQQIVANLPPTLLPK